LGQVYLKLRSLPINLPVLIPDPNPQAKKAILADNETLPQNTIPKIIANIRNIIATAIRAFFDFIIVSAFSFFTILSLCKSFDRKE